MKYMPALKVKIYFLIYFAGTLILLGCANSPQTTEIQQANTANKDTQVLVQKNTPNKAGELPHILVFTKTKAYRHKNISDGVYALREIGKGNFLSQSSRI
jgi:hypothetical protein